MSIDKGTWTAKIAARSGFGGAKVERVLLDSDDFEHDVLLEVRGDFANAQERLDYAQNLADRLNATKPSEA